VIGTLKGFDPLMNLVLDEVKEAMTGELSLHASSLGIMGVF
jgi:small nuclear ribonucleoprotein (snRNP)-like protein